MCYGVHIIHKTCYKTLCINQASGSEKINQSNVSLQIVKLEQQTLDERRLNAYIDRKLLAKPYDAVLTFIIAVSCESDMKY